MLRTEGAHESSPHHRPAPPAHHHWHSTGPTAPRSVDLQSVEVVTLSSFQCMGWSTTTSVAEQWGTWFMHQ